MRTCAVRQVNSNGASGALVAVCGELAADPQAAPLLVGMGVRELSVSPLSIPQVKEAVRAVDTGAARGLATLAVASEGPDAVRALLAGMGRGVGGG